MIDTLVGAFGADGTYLTEFAPNSNGLNYYSKDEAVQAVAVKEMIEYIKASGMAKALWYCWKDDRDARFGVVKKLIVLIDYYGIKLYSIQGLKNLLLLQKQLLKYLYLIQLNLLYQK